MKLMENRYIIEVTKDDVEIITDALNAFYVENRKKQVGTRLEPYREQVLRNAFAGLVNRRYMGEDA